MARSPRIATSYVALGLLGLLVVGLPLAHGGVDAPTLIVEVVLSSCALVLALWGFPAIPAVAMILLAVLGFQIFQLIPVPSSWHTLSTLAFRVYEISLHPVGLYPGPRPFSLDPASSAARFAEGVACLAAYVVAWTYSGSRQRLRFLCGVVGLSGVIVAALVIGAALFNLGPLVEPHFPFVNRNHLAAGTHLGAFACLGLALHSRGPGRVLWLLGFVTVAAVGILSLSRSGFGAFLFGTVLYGALVLRRGGALRGRSGRGLLTAGLAVGVVASVVGYMASDSIVARLRTIPSALGEAKPYLWRASLNVVRDSPWLGIGRGSFATVYTGYKTDTIAVTYTHVENEWLQPLVDLGVPGGLLLVGVLAWVWLSAARRNARGALQIGLLAGTAAVAVHDLADFSLEIPGVAVPFFACLGALGDGLRALTLRRWGLVVSAMVLGAMALGGATLGAAKAHRNVESANQTAGAVVKAARADLFWHPADYLPHAAAGAALASARRCSEAEPWLERAMLLNPTNASAHRIMGRCLWALGRPELASREYRLAIAYGDSRALEEVMPRYPALGPLLQAVPDTPDDRLRLGSALIGSRPADAAEVLQRLLDEDLDERALLPLAQARLALRQFDRSLALARRLLASSPDRDGYLLAYSSLSGLGETSRASDVLREGALALPGDSTILTELAQLSIQARRFSEAKRFAEQILPRSPFEAFHRDSLVASALAAQGRIPEAIERAEAASTNLPDSPEPLMLLAGLLGSAGRYDSAIDALVRAAGLPGADVARCKEQIAQFQKLAADRAGLVRDPSQP